MLEPLSGDKMEPVRQISSLPSGVFKAFDPNVERALAGPVGEVFLSHMTNRDAIAKPPTAPVAKPSPRNQVEHAEIDAFLTEYSALQAAPTPDLTEDLRAERMWVLTDLATNGTGRARELATRELRGIVGQLSTSDDLDIEVLQQLVETIETQKANRNTTVLLQALLSSARQALRNLEKDLQDHV